MLSTKEHLKTQYDVQSNAAEGEERKTLFDVLDMEVEYDLDEIPENGSDICFVTKKSGQDKYEKALGKRRALEREVAVEVAAQTRLLEDIQSAKNDLLQCELENDLPKDAKSKKRRKGACC